jgi:hypothetical protein
MTDDDYVDIGAQMASAMHLGGERYEVPRRRQGQFRTVMRMDLRRLGERVHCAMGTLEERRVEESWYEQLEQCDDA